MKNVFKFAAVGIVLLASFSAKAAKSLDVSVVHEQVVRISLTEVRKNEQLIIKDYEGNFLYSKILKAARLFEKSFDLGSLKKGIYFIEVENEDQIMITPILKNDYEVTRIDRANKTILKPQYKEVANEFFSFSFSNSIPEEVHIRLFDDMGNVLTEEKSANVVVSRHYNVSQLSKGRYVFLLSVGRKTFNKEFYIE